MGKGKSSHVNVKVVRSKKGKKVSKDMGELEKDCGSLRKERNREEWQGGKEVRGKELSPPVARSKREMLRRQRETLQLRGGEENWRENQKKKEATRGSSLRGFRIGRRKKHGIGKDPFIRKGTAKKGVVSSKKSAMN